MMRLAIVLTLCTAPALADGPGTDYPASTDPCATPFPDFATWQAMWFGPDAADGYRMAQLLRDRRCGDVQTPAEIWAARGWTDATLLAAIFNGHDSPTPPPAQIPLPTPGPALAAALALLWIKGRRA